MKTSITPPRYAVEHRPRARAPWRVVSTHDTVKEAQRELLRVINSRRGDWRVSQVEGSSAEHAGGSDRDV